MGGGEGVEDVEHIYRIELWRVWGELTLTSQPPASYDINIKTSNPF